MTEELYSVLFGAILNEQSWPGYDEAKTVDDEIEIVLQINGKVKEKIMIPAGLDKPAMEKIAMDSERVQALTEGKTIVKVIAVPGKLVNVVVK